MREKDKFIVFGTLFVIVVAIFCAVFLDPPHKNDSAEKVPVIVCPDCNGTGECIDDVNLINFEASCALWINHHIMVEKCKVCSFSQDKNFACEKAAEFLKKTLKHYNEIGQDFQSVSCPKCLGMGSFSSKDLSTGKWMTQEDFDKKHKE